jgi:manganese/zinc/iron transport system ATP- binding protein
MSVPLSPLAQPSVLSPRPSTRDQLCFDDVTVCYGPKPAVHHVSATIPCGSLVALMGPNGAGKSTLLRTILGWHRLTTGRITLGGTPTVKIRRRIGYLPQRTSVDWDFPITVRDVVAMGRYQVLGPFRRFSAVDHDIVNRALQEMDMAWLAERQIAELSGGQQQRVFLARAVASGADVFLLDEPFAGLDPSSTADLVRRLQYWANHGRLVITVVHDIPLARQYFPQTLLIRGQLIAMGTTADVLSEKNLAVAYGASYVAERSLVALTHPPVIPDLGKSLRDTRVGRTQSNKPGNNPS